VEWVPREENTFAEELSKLLIPDASMLSHAFFRKLEERFGTHTVDLFASDINTHCGRLYSLHWCRGTSGVNTFAFNWGGESAWASCPYTLLGRVWRKLRNNEASVTLLVPLWESTT
jgi:hypothetical protein